MATPSSSHPGGQILGVLFNVSLQQTSWVLTRSIIIALHPTIPISCLHHLSLDNASYLLSLHSCLPGAFLQVSPLMPDPCWTFQCVSITAEIMLKPFPKVPDHLPTPLLLGLSVPQAWQPPFSLLKPLDQSVFTHCPSAWTYLSGGSDGKESAHSAGDPGPDRSPVEGNGNPFQYSYLENSMDRGDWQSTVHGVAKSWTRLNDSHFHITFPLPGTLFSWFPHGWLLLYLQ